MLGIFTQHLRYVFGILLLLCSTAVFAQTNGHTVQSTSSVRFFANNAPWTDIHYTINGGGQQNIRMTHNADNSNTLTLSAIPAGATVRYFMTIGVAAGGQTDTAWVQFTCCAMPTSSSSSTAPSTGNGYRILTSSSAQFFANNAPWADLHYTINGGGQLNIRMTLNADKSNTYTVSAIPAGAVVRYFMTIGTAAGGQIDTAWAQFNCCTGGSSSAPSSVANSSVSTSRSSSSVSTSRSSVATSQSSVSSSSSSVALGAIVPLYSNTTTLEPVIQFDRGDALVTRISDRGRDRHAKESQFQAYDHFLSFYWEHRTAVIEIVDYVAKGGSVVRMNVTTQFRLNNTEAENRWFYRGVGTVAEFYDNGTMNVVDDTHYFKERSFNAREGRNIQIGDKLEFEMSQFLDHTVPHGRSAYYGTSYLYIVGEGLVPWDVTGAFGTLGGTKDSVKIPEKAWLGGKTTLPYNHSNEPDNHFIQMATNLGAGNGQAFVLGRRVHHASFIDGSHDEHVVDNGTFADTVGKAGPHYVSDRCAGCHVRNGRAAAAPVGQPLEKWVFKVADINGNSHPNLGRALQPKSTGGAATEGTPSIAFWSESAGLRKPNYQFSGVAPAKFSARVAPQLVGIGLLEAIPEATILAKEDVNDANGDGISGKANRVTDPVTGQTRLGRFGYKAAATSVKHQVASAFNMDMGVMSSIFPNPDCGSAQTDCGSGGAEVSDTNLNNLVKYVSTLGVRPQRNFNDAAVLRGETQFAASGCVACHTGTTVQTSQFHPLGELRSQTIRPFTDMLLHDMGADMADNLGEGQATGAEWRTAPLWGLGLAACVTGGVTNAAQGAQVCTPVHSYLHDGRARTIEEAILWHGGEGQAAKASYQALGASQKQDVLRFLESL